LSFNKKENHIKAISPNKMANKDNLPQPSTPKYPPQLDIQGPATTNQQGLFSYKYNNNYDPPYVGGGGHKTWSTASQRSDTSSLSAPLEKATERNMNFGNGKAKCGCERAGH